MITSGKRRGLLRLSSHIAPHTIWAGGREVETSVIILDFYFSSG
jgi:hypothetical protein